MDGKEILDGLAEEISVEYTRITSGDGIARALGFDWISLLVTVFESVLAACKERKAKKLIETAKTAKNPRKEARAAKRLRALMTRHLPDSVNEDDADNVACAAAECVSRMDESDLQAVMDYVRSK